MLRVTGRELVTLVKSRAYRKRLAEAARTTAATGCETGFVVYRDMYSSRQHLTDVVRGSPTSIRLDRQVPRTRVFPFYWLHFHPSSFDGLTVSCADVLSLDNEDVPYEMRAIEGVAHVDNAARQGCVLHFQKGTDATLKDPVTRQPADHGVVQQVRDRSVRLAYEFSNHHDFMQCARLPSFADVLEIAPYIRASAFGFELRSSGPALVGETNALRTHAHEIGPLHPNPHYAREYCVSTCRRQREMRSDWWDFEASDPPFFAEHADRGFY